MLPQFETIKEFEDERFEHGFFGKRGGVSTGDYCSLNLGTGSNDHPASVAKNRELVRTTFGANRIYSCHQVHGCSAIKVSPDTPDRLVADIMVTKEPGVALCVLTADCVPVLMADTDAGIIAAVHAGWRGAVGGVVEAALEKVEQIGGDRNAVQVAIGPCILKESYEVGEDFRDQVLAATAWAGELFEVKSNRKWYFDLPAYVENRLQRASCNSIASMHHDTFAMDSMYFSNRRQNKLGNLDYGRNGSVIMLKS